MTTGRPEVAAAKTKPPKRAVEPLTSTEVAALLRQCSTTAPTGIRNRALITVMYRAGLRIDEALKLKAPDINPARGTVRVLHGKGDKPRTLGIDDGDMALIQRWMDRRAELGHRHGPLFCTLKGTELAPVYVRNMMHRIAAKAGIEKRVHPHGLRHSFAVELSLEGVPMPIIQQMLGHAHLSTTDIYLRHVAPADVIAAGRSRKQWNPEEL
jgi:site-specific recombinase XerD